ncbi:hypothetical protein Goklo_025220 [Gossypium klotzschianum]|uniref:DUF7745 domain-containing protein n=1 Tax=Gossypium klotzschianum TaxID=34286 RepID=A0A7J8WCI0_9ROSI|nr:hypothetical protein [Gossypium klotzschianum]
MKVDKHLFRALSQFWNPAYSCFKFEKVDLVPTVEEYVCKNSSRHSLLESYKCTELFEEVDECNQDE